MLQTPAEFTKEMRKTHTIYMPDMLHYHNELLKAAFRYAGYRLDVVPEYPELTDTVFRCVNSDYCTCAIGIVGNLLTMMEDSRFQGRPIAFLEPQTGGACRAGNYYNLIINCLQKNGYGDVPVLSLNLHGLEKHSGFQINARMFFASVAAVCFSDLLMTLLLQLKPYEKRPGQTKEVYEKWIRRLGESISHGRCLFRRKPIYEQIARDFRAIELDGAKLGKKRKVGIVGEIYVKFSPIGNRHLERLLEEHDCEYRLGGFLNYCIFVVYTDMVSAKINGAGPAVKKAYEAALSHLCRLQEEMNRVLEEHGFSHDGAFRRLQGYAGEIISDEYVIGDGWLTVGEAIDHIKNGYDRVLAVHPFGCLVSHVGTRGTLQQLRRVYPEAKIHSIEYDYEQPESLRESRILLAIH